MDEEEEEAHLASKRGTALPKDDNIKIVAIPPNKDTIMVPMLMFPGNTTPLTHQQLAPPTTPSTSVMHQLML